MTKKIAIPKGNLLRIAGSKSITNLSALEEKTGVDDPNPSPACSS